jgi:AcrR family transcriptional regulator
MAGNDRRTRVLQAAVDLIAENGVRGLRLEDVADRADVALSLIYYHFGNRIDLLRAVFRYANEVTTVPLMNATPGATARQLLERSLVREVRGKSARANAIVWNELNATAVFIPELQDEVRQTTRTWVEGLEELIRQGQVDGSVRLDVDPTDEAQILAHLLDGLLTQWLVGSLTAPRAQTLIRQAIRSGLSPD